MPEFDVYRSVSTGGLVVDCQSDLLDHLSTRFVVPLFESADAPASVPRLTPTLMLHDRPMVFATPLAAGVPRTDLGERMGSVAGERYAIQAALDTLTGSY